MQPGKTEIAEDDRCRPGGTSSEPTAQRHTVNVNGVARQVVIEGDTPLLWVLREEWNLPGADNNPVREGIERCDGGGDEPPGLVCTSCHGQTNRAPREAPPGAYAAKLKLPWMMPTRELVILEPLRRIRSQAARRVALCEKWRTAEIQTAPDDPTCHFVHHTHDDELIEWAFKPGGDRTPVPGGRGSFEMFKDAARTWASWLRRNEPCDVFGGAAGAPMR